LNANEIIFIDTEIDSGNKKVQDIGAITGNKREFHSKSLLDFSAFLQDHKYVCGHNILNHDLIYLKKETASSSVKYFIDTLYFSPLLFPKKPYHHLVKDYKLTSDELNNPLNDAKLARNLFNDEVAAFINMDKPLQNIYHLLLKGNAEFTGFFSYIGYENTNKNISGLIREYFAGNICENAPIEKIAEKYPVELAYALSQISVIKHDSITPPWVLRTYPRIENILHFLRSRNCHSGVGNFALGCAYCREALDETKALKKFFNHDNFRIYDGEPLQQNAVKAAVDGKSILVVFPTGGGKSITFQLPALMAGLNEKGLTVVISPLQSLMKDQTDNLEKQHNITEAVTINSSLDPIERAKAFERIEDGSAGILYISPESLRSKSIEILLLKRNVVRFVIDEAHCFSAWGHDFRTDYLYIGDFIQSLKEKKDMPQNIPVSCFTATAKQKVIADIKEYFKTKLSLELEVFKSSTRRENLQYHILYEEDDTAKYLKLRQLITDKDHPTIVYVSRTKKTEILADKLTNDGFPAKPYHGQMDKQIRVLNQDSFMRGDVNIIVATTAFGMGVDKKDVKMVIHYDISDSLENYVQEAGRAGRDENIKADCYVLYNKEDLNKHFNRLNQTKMSQKEIQQVWKALKDLSKSREIITQSALEIARKAGWDDSVNDMETRIKTAINALEQSGFIKRGQNMPRIFADSILVKNMAEAREKIDNSTRFDDTSRRHAIRIIGSLISAKSKSRGKNDEGEDRVDYISDRLGIPKEDVIKVIGLLREEKILSDAKDLIAFIKKRDKTNRSENILTTHINIEYFLFKYLDNSEKTYNIKEMNTVLQELFPETSMPQLNTILNYFKVRRFIKRTQELNKNYITLKPYSPLAEIQKKCEKRYRIAKEIIEYLFSKIAGKPDSIGVEDTIVEFSVLELKNKYDNNLFDEKAGTEEIEEALYYLIKTGSMKIEGGFLVLYNAMQIERLEKDYRAQYNKEDYSILEQYYLNKRHQIHIVGEYAKRMINNYDEAMTFVNDYFILEYDDFLRKYFKGRKDELNENITPEKFKQLFGGLSPAQLSIIKDQESNCIVVVAGPGSGKTKLLTHKLASLCMMEDVKHEQMLMLTFSRAAATEFKKRLIALIGNAANFIQITTFHSYCFDLLGKVGDIKVFDDIINQTIDKIAAGEVELIKITKTILVIDEAQDMSASEYSLIKTLIETNDNLRVIAVGDDDQNIYTFRGSSFFYFEYLLKEPGARKYELVDNYRSGANIVEFANKFAEKIEYRFKTIPIMPMKNKNGIINVTKLISEKIEIPVVNFLLKNKPSGSTCIVTRTNEEALNIAGLLLKNGVSARQIQTNNDFNLYNLAELRDFINDIIINDDISTVTADIWQNAKIKLNIKYKGSDNLPDVIKLINDFEETNSETMYKSDFIQFVHESKLEDFVSASGNTILVSTIHQTKGREFDNVFLALSGFKNITDEKKREIYVAITRAKENLYVFYNGGYFDDIHAGNMHITTDNNDYPAPAQINMHLSHKDVNLSFFIYVQSDIDSIISGCELEIHNTGCFFNKKQILKFSSVFYEKIEKQTKKGYFPTRAIVKYVVFWKDKDTKKEIKILLPDVEFCKK